MPVVSTLVRATLPRKKPDYRGEVPSIVYYLHRIESEKKLYHPGSIGTDLLGEDGKERKASSRRSLLSTATEHALQRRRSFGVVVGVTISFSVRCNDDCYRASLTMHTDVASLSNSATLLQCMVFACVSSTVDGSRRCQEQKNPCDA